MQVVILAGGLATRLGARTREVPKSLLPVAGRPFIDWQLEQIRDSGVPRVLLCTGHLGEAIQHHVGRGERWALEVTYCSDGERLLGTAGALRRALQHLDDEFLVTYGDSYLPFDYRAPLRDLQAHPEALGTMAVHENRGQWDRSNTEIAGDLVVRYDRRPEDAALTHIDYGATALRRAAIAGLPEDTVQSLGTVQANLARQGQLRAYRATNRFYEIGSPAGWAELDQYLGDHP